MAWIRVGPFGIGSDGEAMIRKGVTRKIGEVVVANGELVHQFVQIRELGCSEPLAPRATWRRCLPYVPMAMIMRRIRDNDVGSQSQSLVAVDTGHLTGNVVRGVV